MVVFSNECGRIEFVDWYIFHGSNFSVVFQHATRILKNAFSKHTYEHGALHFAPSGTSVYGLDFS
jgi:hypothetical protein